MLYIGNSNFAENILQQRGNRNIRLHVVYKKR